MTKRVGIVGTGPTADKVLDDNVDEIWGVTQTWLKHYDFDRIFEPHPEEFLQALAGERSVQHYEWCREQDYVDIYTNSDIFPRAKVYPLELVGEALGRLYLKSSVAYAFCLAMYEGADYIALYGIDMDAESEYMYQRPNMEYWIGRAEERGIEVNLEHSGLVDDALVYGKDFTRWATTEMIAEHRRKYKKALWRAEEKDGNPVQGTRLRGAIQAMDAIRQEHIPKAGYLDRQSIVVIRDYYLALMVDENDKWQRLGLWGAYRACNNLIDVLDGKTGDMEI